MLWSAHLLLLQLLLVCVHAYGQFKTSVGAVNVKWLTHRIWNNLQVRQSPGAVLTVPIVVYATARGTYMGVQDAFVRTSVNGHTASSVVLVFDTSVRLFWAVFLCLAAVVLCAQLLRAVLIRA